MKENQCEKYEDLHKSVLLEELVDSFEMNLGKKNVIVDCTLGVGGHASEIIKKMNPGDIFIGFDADEKNLALAKNRLENENKKKVDLFFVGDNFLNLKSNLEKLGIEKITGIYYDLGISSIHADNGERGFSFSQNGSLDMRFDKTKGINAYDVVNTYKKEDLERIFLEYGEETLSKKIANEIVEKRKTKKIFSTFDLVDVIGNITKHPKVLARIFQAIRIEVNAELENLKLSLKSALESLEKDGIIFVISFHSLEDRIVKDFFRDESRDCICDDFICTCKHKKTLEILTKKPIIPSEKEILDNKRSRSAKARKAKKII